MFHWILSLVPHYSVWTPWANVCDLHSTNQLLLSSDHSVGQWFILRGILKFCRNIFIMKNGGRELLVCRWQDPGRLATLQGVGWCLSQGGNCSRLGVILNVYADSRVNVNLIIIEWTQNICLYFIKSQRTSCVLLLYLGFATMQWMCKSISNCTFLFSGFYSESSIWSPFWKITLMITVLFTWFESLI